MSIDVTCRRSIQSLINDRRLSKSTWIEKKFYKGEIEMRKMLRTYFDSDAERYSCWFPGSAWEPRELQALPANQ